MPRCAPAPCRGRGVKSLQVSNWDRAPKRLFIGAILRMGVSIDDWPKPI